MRNSIFLAFAILVLAPVAADGSPRTLTRTEMQTLPPTEVRQRVADQVADFINDSNPLLGSPSPRDADMFRRLAETIGLGPDARFSKIAAETRTRLPALVSVRPFPNDDPSKILRGLQLVTKPFATQTAGLCRMDIFWISYRPSGAINGADTPLHMTSLNADRSFRVLSALPSETATPADATQHAADADACAKLDPDKDPFFGAWNDAHALQGAWMFQSLMAGFKMKVLPFAIECHDRATPDACRSFIEGYLSDVLLDTSCEDWVRSCQLESVKDKWVHLDYDAVGPTPKIVHVEVAPKFAPVAIKPRKP